MAEAITVEGDLDALERQVESGFACQGWLRILWRFAEWQGPREGGLGGSEARVDDPFAEPEE